jgi:hypothetical protein
VSQPEERAGHVVVTWSGTATDAQIEELFDRLADAAHDLANRHGYDVTVGATLPRAVEPIEDQVELGLLM